MRDSRQISVLRSLFRTLHPLLKSGIETGLAPARRLLTSSQDGSLPPARAAKHDDPNRTDPKSPYDSAATSDSATQEAKKLPPLPRTLTDEHLVAELDSVSRQFERAGQTDSSAHKNNRRRDKPRRGNRHLSRDTLLSLLEEAKVRIQVLETELELARGKEEQIPMLTEEWNDDQHSLLSPKPD